MKKITCFCLTLCLLLGFVKAQAVEKDSVSYRIEPQNEAQYFDGWGVSLCWWANMCGQWDDEKIDEIVDWLVSPEGLNYRIFRYNIGGGDDPQNRNCDLHHMGRGKGLRAEMEGFKDSSDGPYIWSRDEAQRKIMLKIKEKRPDAVFEAFSNSCPYYMTYSGCCAGHKNAGKDNLRPEYYEEFAHYLVDVCKHYKEEYGIEFKTLEPFNEPMTSYWGANGGQEGCHFDVASQIAFVKVLSPVLKASGLKTVISASDETDVMQGVRTFRAYRDAGILPLLGQWNVHTYGATDQARKEISELCREEGITLWMSEVGSGGNGIAGNLKLAQRLMDDIRLIKPEAWLDWQYMEENNDQWCFISGNFKQQTYYKVKNYSVRQHFSKYIPEGSVFLETPDRCILVAKRNGGKELVLVALNAGDKAVAHQAELDVRKLKSRKVKAVITDADRDVEEWSNFQCEGNTLSFELPPYSIATFVVRLQ